MFATAPMGEGTTEGEVRRYLQN